MNFSKETAVHAAGDHFFGDICPGWDIDGNANGGYLMALGARAMAEASRPHPVSVTAHFLSPGKVGPVTINPDIIKAGRSFSTVRASVHGPERPIIELLGSFSELQRVDGNVIVDAEPPDLPDPEDCIRVVPHERGLPPAMMSKVDMRLHPDDAGFYAGRGSGKPLMRGWIRLQDEEPIDAFGLIFIADAFPPTVFNANLPMAWIPTLEMTTQVRGIPEPGWLRCKFSTRFINGGVLEEDGELWDSGGRMVALSRQLALMPRD
ncbi:thioesterase family protein [Pseudohalioglobus lutimaris]|uniref:Thioesterase family protein n=1 Tax=Pseudohalioglobus lutimaris TaxID=1737061 RepID=A0A2N5X8G3_9GAMM|nr:thioesterase family protein [Pseudohalioglobus lutimaris]PLW70758.1 thioesterase family protein [Pseudohalioglobus lutimaris]